MRMNIAMNIARLYSETRDAVSNTDAAFHS